MIWDCTSRYPPTLLCNTWNSLWVQSQSFQHALGIEEGGKTQKWDCFDIWVGFSWNDQVFEKQKLIRSVIQQSTAPATSVLSCTTFVPSRPYSSISSLSCHLRLLLLWLFMNFTSITMVMNSVFWVIYELNMHIHITFPYGRILWSMMQSSSYNLSTPSRS